FLLIRRPPPAPLFPYTTLFRSGPAERIVALAMVYLGYAARHRARWTALFEHRMAGGQSAPDWYLARQAGLFRHVEAPLAALRPEDRKSTRLNSSHVAISYAVFC